MKDEEVVAAAKLIESIDISAADVATCKRVIAAARGVKAWLAEAEGKLVVPPRKRLCSIHCHNPVHLTVS